MTRAREAGRPIDSPVESVPAWPLVLFRFLVTLETLLAFGQAVFAGSFLSGRYGSLGLHEAGASATALIAVLQTLAAVLLWRPGRGPAWPAVACAGLVVAEALQISLGYSHVLALHVPLGTAIITAAAALLVWAWRRGRRGDL